MKRLESGTGVDEGTGKGKKGDSIVLGGMRLLAIDRS